MKYLVTALLLISLFGGVYYGVQNNHSGRPVQDKTLEEYAAQAREIRLAREARAELQRRDEEAKAILAKATSKADVDRAKAISPRVVPVYSPDSVADMVRRKTESVWGKHEWDDMHELVMRESGFNPYAQNPRSTAFGVFQFLDSTWKSYGCVKTVDVSTQIECGFRYLQARYGTPSNALAFHNKHGYY